MISRRNTLLVLLFFASAELTIAGLIVPQVDANPVLIEVAHDGFVIPSNQEVQMPSANVSVHVLITGAFQYDVSANCSFELSADSATDCTVAFAFPEAWLTEGGTNGASQDIYIDGVQVESTIVDWEDLSPDLQVNVTEGTLEYCSYAVFNTTFSENQTRILDVDTTLHIVSHGRGFEFRYAVGSGKYWAGQTDETVIFRVDNQAGLQSLSFHPGPSTLVNVSATIKIATWHIDVDSFGSFWVTFHAWQPKVDYLTDILATIGVTALAVIVCVIARPPRKKQSATPQETPPRNTP